MTTKNDVIKAARAASQWHYCRSPENIDARKCTLCVTFAAYDTERAERKAKRECSAVLSSGARCVLKGKHDIHEGTWTLIDSKPRLEPGELWDIYARTLPGTKWEWAAVSDVERQRWIAVADHLNAQAK